MLKSSSGIPCIPPITRQRRPVRIATGAGLTIGGGQIGKNTSIPFRPKIILPNLEVQKQREIYYAAIQSFRKRLDELIADATEPGEIEFWQARLNQIKGL